MENTGERSIFEDALERSINSAKHHHPEFFENEPPTNRIEAEKRARAIRRAYDIVLDDINPGWPAVAELKEDFQDWETDAYIAKWEPEVYPLRLGLKTLRQQLKDRRQTAGERFTPPGNPGFRGNSTTGPIQAEILDTKGNVIRKTEAKGIRTERTSRG